MLNWFNQVLVAAIIAIDIKMVWGVFQSYKDYNRLEYEAQKELIEYLDSQYITKLDFSDIKGKVVTIHGTEYTIHSANLHSSVNTAFIPHGYIYLENPELKKGLTESSKKIQEQLGIEELRLLQCDLETFYKTIFGRN